MSEQSRIAPQRPMKHSEAINYVTTLIIDLKKQLLGHETEPLTMERLDEWTQKHCRNLQECREQGIYY